MSSWIMSIVWMCVIIAAICYNVKKIGKNRKSAENGEDLERIRKAIEPLLGESISSRALYAHWEKRETHGRSTKITYFRYAVAYQDQAMYVIPLHVDKKTHQIQPGQPVVYDRENLGKITVGTTRKDGAVKRIKLSLDNKNGYSLLELYVDAKNLHNSRWFPIQVLQQDECEAFERFITAMSQRVAMENPGVDDLIKANNNESLGLIGAGASIFGVVFAIFYPPAGIVVALIGLIMTIISTARGAKSKKYLIISIACLAVCAVIGGVYLANFK